MVRHYVITLLLAILGGVIARAAALPLPWIFGPMLAMLLAAPRAPQLDIPKPITNGANIVWGIMIGSYVNAAVLQRAPEWGLSLALFIAFIVIGTGICFVIARRRYDLATAYYMSVPGGLAEMYALGTAVGADGRVVAVGQTVRALLIVTILPIILYTQLGHGSVPAAAVFQFAWHDYLVLAGAVLLVPLALRFHWPAAYLTGAACGSALLHGLGLTEAPVPPALLVAAQIIIGAGIGLGFKGFTWREVVSAARIAMLSGIIFFILGGLWAWAALHIAGFPFYDLWVSFTPGGIATMSIVAATYGFQVPFVALHHIVRLALIYAGAPAVFGFLCRRAAQ